ncbi:hypothetical protein V2S84_17530 [Azotobacter chroococcum]|nr:hypothetical protein [Azotobacter chroococcum]
MSEKNNGGPAFPQPCAENGWASNNEYGQAGGGLSLRDYFAAKALAALINHPNKDGENRGAKAVPILAKFAYEYADAMLAARNA